MKDEIALSSQSIQYNLIYVNRGITDQWKK